MIEFFVASVLVGCLSSWVVILLRKWKVLEWVQVNGDLWLAKLLRWNKWLNDYFENNDPQPNLMSQLASCDYCLNWWIGWVIVIVALVVTGWWWLLGVPFFSTTIGRLLSGN